jgi:hypothetical protein
VSLTTLLNALQKVNAYLRRDVAEGWPGDMATASKHIRHFRQAQTFERRLRQELRDLDDLRSIKAQ